MLKVDTFFYLISIVGCDGQFNGTWQKDKALG